MLLKLDVLLLYNFNSEAIGNVQLGIPCVDG